MESSQKIQNKVNQLDRIERTKNGFSPDALAPTYWVAIPGYFALTKFDNSSGKNVFNPTSGLIVKVFLNTHTGETKMYPYNMFES